MPTLTRCTGDHSSIALVSLSCIASVVIACDANRPLGTETALGAVAQTPAAPAGLTARAEAQGQIDLAWQDNSGNEAGFEVRGSAGGSGGTFTIWTTTAANVTATSFTGLGPGESYCFEVRSFAKKGQRTYYSGSSNTACVTTLAPPPPTGPNAPSGTTATPAGPHYITVTWVDNSDDEEYFRPEQAPSINGPWGSTGWLLGSGITSFNHWNIPTEQQICYRVVAYNAKGESPASNVDCTAMPAAPSGFTGVDADGPSIELSWTDNSSVEDGYELSRASPNGQWTTIATLPPGTTGYRDATVTIGTSYWYGVRAMRDGGFSGAANSVSMVAGGVMNPPAKPSLDEVSGYFLGTMRLTWRLDPATADSTRIERCDKESCADADFTAVATVPTTSSGMYYQDSGLLEWVRYTYRILTVNRAGISPASDPMSGRTCIEDWDYMGPCSLPFPGTHGMASHATLSAGPSMPGRGSS